MEEKADEKTDDWIAQEEILIVVDSKEEDWYCLHDISLNGQVNNNSNYNLCHATIKTC